MGFRAVERVTKNPLEAGRGLLFISIGKENHGILFESLLAAKGTEGFKIFEGDPHPRRRQRGFLTGQITKNYWVIRSIVIGSLNHMVT